MGMKSVFSDLGFSFCRYFRLLSLHYRMRVFIQRVRKLQNFFGLGGCDIDLVYCDVKFLPRKQTEIILLFKVAPKYYISDTLLIMRAIPFLL